MIDVVDFDKDITEDDNVDKVASAQPGFVKDQVWRLTKLEASKILKKVLSSHLRYNLVEQRFRRSSSENLFAKTKRGPILCLPEPDQIL